MSLNTMIRSLKQHPGYSRMGMVATHLGIVRERSLNGGRVQGIQVKFDERYVAEIVNKIKRMNGIIEVIVETYEGMLNVGDEIMAVAVGGDTREHVFPALIEAVDLLKKKATTKTEVFAREE